MFGTITVSTLRKWLSDPSQTEDLVTSAPFVGGFEWPTVMMITSTIYESEFHVRNIVMRSMCKLVWLKTNIIEQVHELNVSIIHLWRESHFLQLGDIHRGIPKFLGIF